MMGQLFSGSKFNALVSLSPLRALIYLQVIKLIH